MSEGGEDVVPEMTEYEVVTIAGWGGLNVSISIKSGSIFHPFKSLPFTINNKQDENAIEINITKTKKNYSVLSVSYAPANCCLGGFWFGTDSWILMSFLSYL